MGFGLGRRYPRSMHDSAHRHEGDLTQFSRGRPAHAEVDLHSLTRRERRMAEARWAGRGASGFSGTSLQNSVPDLTTYLDNSYTREVFELPGGIPLPKEYTPQLWDTDA